MIIWRKVCRYIERHTFCSINYWNPWIFSFIDLVEPLLPLEFQCVWFLINAVENCYKLMSNSKIMLTMVRTFFIRVKKEKVMKLINVLRGMETRQKCSSSTWREYHPPPPKTMNSPYYHPQFFLRIFYLSKMESNGFFATFLPACPAHERK